MATHAPVTWDHYIYSSIFLHCLYINTQFFVHMATHATSTYNPECVLSLADELMLDCWRRNPCSAWIAHTLNSLSSMRSLKSSMKTWPILNNNYKITIILDCHVASLIYIPHACMNEWEFVRVMELINACIHACISIYMCKYTCIDWSIVTHAYIYTQYFADWSLVWYCM